MALAYRELVSRRSDPARGEAALLETAVLDCQTVQAIGCRSCPLHGRCVLHRSLLRRLDGALGLEERAVMALRTTSFTVDDERCTASLVRLDPSRGGAVYRVSRDSLPPVVVTVPMEESGNDGHLSEYLIGQVRLGGAGMQLLKEG